jgi:uncharacterized protein YprB with RNaseH-like and TPR domain
VDLKQRLAALRRQEGSRPVAGGEESQPLRARLERLTVGPRRLSDRGLARLLGGEVIADGLLLVEQLLPLSFRHGDQALAAILQSPLGLLAEDAEVRPHELLFLDTETTGLAGGTGTLAFLLGLGRIEGEALRLRQFFLTGFRGEAALLSEAVPWLKDAGHLVTFNGKCFDVPLLLARYRLSRLGNPLGALGHIDLLHPTRAVFARTWPDCRLQTAERRLLAFSRADDLPGHLVPQAWFDFVRRGAVQKVPAILEHNRWDLVSLARLAAVLARIYGEPGHADSDVLAVAKSHLRRGREREALRHLTENQPRLDEAGLLELAALHRRAGAWGEAVRIWERLAERGSLEALERLAKYHEHVRRDYRKALALTETLLARERHEHSGRAQRLAAKLARRNEFPARPDK